MAHPVARITRLSLDGYGARRARSFAGKTANTNTSGTRRQRSIKALIRRRPRKC